jgi:Ca2+-binding RTX toxin-like protein
LVAILAGLGLSALGVEAAHAASVVRFQELNLGMALKVEGSGDKNDVTVGVDPALPTAYLITDASGILDPVPLGCVRMSSTAIRCFVVNNIDGIVVELRGGDDQFKVSAGSIPEPVLLFVFGGEGDDTIRGRDGPGRDWLNGEAGKDRLFGEGGNDKLFGGGNDDELDGGPGHDDLYGEAGEDILNGGEGFGRDHLDGGGGTDVLNGLSEADTLFGGNGSDVLLGGGGDDKLFGGKGKDGLKGGKGKDRLVGGPQTDRLNGGPGRDKQSQ